MRQALPQVSERRICRLLEVARSAMNERVTETRPEPFVDATRASRLEELIQVTPLTATAGSGHSYASVTASMSTARPCTAS